MAQEILFNGLMLVFFIYSFFYVGGNTEAQYVKGELNGIQWSQGIIVLLIVFISLNMYKVYKNRKQDEKFKIEFDILKLVKSKMFIGSIILLSYSFLMDYLGFIVGTIIVFMLYSRLLGEKKIIKLIWTSVLSTVLIYLLFNTLLDIMLPRGTGVFRTMALFIESLF